MTNTVILIAVEMERTTWKGGGGLVCALQKKKSKKKKAGLAALRLDKCQLLVTRAYTKMCHKAEHVVKHCVNEGYLVEDVLYISP